MEYVVLRAGHPTWLAMQLPSEVVDLLRFRPEEGPVREASRSISFVARGPGIARVLATHPAREALAVETVRGRLLASARAGDRHLFSLPTAVVQHLGVQVANRGPRGARGTDDSLLWFVPAPEYYEYRAIVESGKPWSAPSSGPFAHIYLAKSLFPFPKEFGALAELEFRLEEDEWRPGIEGLQRVGRARRVVL
ncbi:MAG TPA: hypothetical protein VMG99_02095 [Thermoplasmata archaeon]|jgi:hypothetical protein|nr:hypothetical protein [Thermoplasmata archaeon]